MKFSYSAAFFLMPFTLPAVAQQPPHNTGKTCSSVGIEIYHLGTRSSKLSLRLVSLYNPHAASINWEKNGHEHTQYLEMPYGWWPTTRENSSDTELLLPSALLWRTRGQTLLVLVAQRDSGVYGYRCPLFYRLQAGHWHLLTGLTKAMQFSNRGSFCFQRNRFYVWDYVADDKLSHGAPQRYWLHQFVWRQGLLRQLKTRITQGKYEDILGLDTLEDHSQRIPPDFDPVREFGLHWRWWDTPRTHDHS